MLSGTKVVLEGFRSKIRKGCITDVTMLHGGLYEGSTMVGFHEVSGKDLVGLEDLGLRVP